MLYRREGYPQENEFVLATVTKIFHSSVFVNLDEYEKGGMIHISEIAPGRVRNIREYVEEGKKIVCKVLRIDKEKGHIDLSYRRVNDAERKLKLEEIKQEQKAEKIIEQLAIELKEPVKKLYEDLTSKVFENHLYLHTYFKGVAVGTEDLNTLGIDKKLAGLLQERIAERFKPQKVHLAGTLKLTTYAPDGVELIKKTLSDIEKSGAQIIYLGGGKYKITLEAETYKEGEKVLEQLTEHATSFITKHEGEASFEREKA